MSKAQNKTAHPGERIAKVMARVGLCSRRDAESWIEAGRVLVNGKKLISAAVNVQTNDIVLVDGKPLPDKDSARVWLYYKPKGLMTTARDPEGRPTVFERLPPEMPRVISIGRLDLNSEGLLLLTNDGELARRLELPSTAWVRRYRVRVNGRIDPKILDQVKTGITIEGVRYGPIEAAVDRQQGANAWITMGLTEGKNREIRRICQHFGWPVSRLIRIAYGPFQLGEMEPGQVTEVKGKLLKDQLKFGNEWKPELSRALPPEHVQNAQQERKEHAAGPYPEARKRWTDRRNDGDREAPERPRDGARGKPRDDARARDGASGRSRDDARAKPRERTFGKPRDGAGGRSRDDARAKPRERTFGKPRDDAGGRSRDDTRAKPRENAFSKPREDTRAKPRGAGGQRTEHGPKPEIAPKDFASKNLRGRTISRGDLDKTEAGHTRPKKSGPRNTMTGKGKFDPTKAGKAKPGNAKPGEKGAAHRDAGKRDAGSRGAGDKKRKSGPRNANRFR